MRDQVEQPDGLGKRRGHLKGLEVPVDVDVEVDRAAFGGLHDGHDRERLAHRLHVKQGPLGDYRSPLLQIGPAKTLGQHKLPILHESQRRSRHVQRFHMSREERVDERVELAGFDGQVSACGSPFGRRRQIRAGLRPSRLRS